MDPIISPWWFYLIGIVEKLDSALCMGGIFTIGVVLFFLAFRVIKFTKATIRIIIIGIIAAFLSTFIPSKDTAYQMLAASVVMPQNIEAVTNTATSLVDYIIETADKLLDEEK